MGIILEQRRHPGEQGQRGRRIGAVAPAGRLLVRGRDVTFLSPTSGTVIDPIRRKLGIRTIVAVGVSVTLALTNLVFDAVNAGYQVVVPRDAVAGLPATYVEAVFEHTLGLVATVTTTAEVVAA